MLENMLSGLCELGYRIAEMLERIARKQFSRARSDGGRAYST